jgi:hypothetical protein
MRYESEVEDKFSALLAVVRGVLLGGITVLLLQIGLNVVEIGLSVIGLLPWQS